MILASQVEEVAPSCPLPHIKFDLTTRAGSATYQEFCIHYTKVLRESGHRPNWQQWEGDADIFIALLRHDLPRSLHLAQVKNIELQADW